MTVFGHLESTFAQDHGKIDISPSLFGMVNSYLCRHPAVSKINNDADLSMMDNVVRRILSNVNG